MFKMGGLRRQLPLVFWTFLIGALSLAALPLVTAGFYSKDMILWEVWSSPLGGQGLWAAGLVGAFITSLYTFRMVFITFFGESHTLVSSLPGRAITIPLVVLATGATLAGFLELPRTLGHWPAFSHFLEHTLPAPHFQFAPVNVELALQGAAAAVVFAGLLFAWACFLPRKAAIDTFAASPIGGGLHRLLGAGWGFDALYDLLLIKPFGALARANRGDALDLAFAGVDRSVHGMAHLFRLTQNGKLRWYMAGIAVGAIAATYLVVYQ
jgi:NADH-quinone oxidoreductase subunit L